MLRQADTGQSAGLAKLRWQLIRVLRHYQLFKHTEVFDPIMRNGASHARDLSVEMKERCIAAGDMYADHVRRWSIEGVGGAWPRYREEATEVVATLRRHIQRERQELERLLAQASVA